MPYRGVWLAVLVTLVAWPAVVRADDIYNFAYAGTFANDQGIQFTYFYLSAASDVQIYTLSDAGGQSFVNNGNSRTNLSGPVEGGGFIPSLSLFTLPKALDNPTVTWGQLSNASGGLLQVSDGSGGLNSSGTGEASISEVLTAGWYVVALTEYQNTANGPDLADGFAEQGQGNFTSAYCGGASAPFCDPAYAPSEYRDGHWALEVVNVYDSLESPEPASCSLLIVGLLMLGVWLQRKKSLAAAHRVTVSRTSR